MVSPRSSVRCAVIGVSLFVLGALLWWWAPLDLGAYRALRVGAASGAARFATVCSAVGGFSGMGPLALAVVVLLLVRRRFGDALWLFATLASGRLLVEGLKLVIRRPRPPVPNRLAIVDSFSFPSSHSAGTTMTCLAFALLAGGRWPVLAPALLAALVIGWSRIALGVHYPSDVLAGWGFGLFWIGLAMRWMPHPAPRSA